MTEDDLDRVEELEMQTFPEPWSKACFRQDIYRPHSLALVAAAGNKVVGYAVAWLDARPAHELHIANIAVRPDHRRQGIGMRLVQAIEEYGRSAGAKTLYLEVRESNTGAQQFYARLGFVRTFVRKGYYSNGENAIVMERDLAPVE